MAAGQLAPVFVRLLSPTVTLARCIRATIVYPGSFVSVRLNESDEKGTARQRRGSQTRRICRPVAVDFLLSLSLSLSLSLAVLSTDVMLVRWQEQCQEIRVLVGNGTTNLAGNRSVDRVVSTAPDEIRAHADSRRLFSL